MADKSNRLRDVLEILNDMARGLDFAIKRFPEREQLIRRLVEDEDFAELCEHYAWMSEAALRHQNPVKAKEYRSLCNKLKLELRRYLHLD